MNEMHTLKTRQIISNNQIEQIAQLSQESIEKQKEI